MRRQFSTYGARLGQMDIDPVTGQPIFPWTLVEGKPVVWEPERQSEPPGSLVYKRMDPEVAEAIAGALVYLSETTPETALAEPCYRELRTNRWHEFQAIAAKTATVLEQGQTPAFTPAELELAALVVECTEALRAKAAASQGETLRTVVTVGGLAATALGLLAFLG